MGITDKLRAIASAMVSTISTVNEHGPAIISAVQADAERAAADEGIEPTGLGNWKKEAAMVVVSGLIGPRFAGMFGGIISLLIDVIYARMKRNGELPPKPAPAVAEEAAG